MIKDSGERTEYETGAVRDCKEGKGRCDLMPLDVLDELLAFPEDNGGVLWYVEQFRLLGSTDLLVIAIRKFAAEWKPEGGGNNTEESYVSNTLLEVSKHFEEGAKKYGPYNWQKGIPIHSYIDSAVRHYLKYRAGWTDEPHDRAFVWNLMCCAWTMQHHPELDDFTELRMSDISLRPYQSELISNVKNSVRSGHMAPCSVLGCDGGNPHLDIPSKHPEERPTEQL